MCAGSYSNRAPVCRSAPTRSNTRCRVRAGLRSLVDAQTRLRDTAETVDRVHGAPEAFDGLEDATRRLKAAKRECESLSDKRQDQYVDLPEEDG
jgi:hypothetical protein